MENVRNKIAFNMIQMKIDKTEKKKRTYMIDEKQLKIA